MPRNNSRERREFRRRGAVYRLRQLADALTKAGKNSQAQEVYKEAVRIEAKGTGTVTS